MQGDEDDDDEGSVRAWERGDTGGEDTRDELGPQSYQPARSSSTTTATATSTDEVSSSTDEVQRCITTTNTVTSADDVSVVDGTLCEEYEREGVTSDRSSSSDIDFQDAKKKEAEGNLKIGSSRELSIKQYLCFFVIGIGLEVCYESTAVESSSRCVDTKQQQQQQLPYHCFLTAYDYFALFEGDNAEFIVTLSFDPTCLLTFFLMLKYGDRISEDKKMIGGFLVQLLTTLFINLLSILDLSYAWSVLITVISMMTVGVMTAALQLTAFAIGGRLPPTCLQGTVVAHHHHHHHHSLITDLF